VFITFHCGTCKAKLEVDSISCGTGIECPRCHSSLSVPHKGPEPGATVGGFKILSLLGKGGMGEVFLARQLSMDRDVAIKILPQALTSDKEEVERFLNEVRLGARLEHPNIVTAYEAGEDAGVYYLAMAYVRGETLESRLKRTGVMTEVAALKIVRKVALALAYAWNKHHMIHRDVKPANIIMNEDGEPKLMDMGLSKTLHDGRPMTTAGTVMGTPNYMSPEQGDGFENLDFRTDVYSLGATLYHMVTNQLPFAGKTLMETLRKQASESLPDPREGNVSISDSCAKLIERMLVRKPEDRYATWEALLADMDVVLSGGTLTGEVLPAGVSVLELVSPVEVEVVEDSKLNRLSSPAFRSVIFGMVVLVVIVGVSLSVWFAVRGKTPKAATRATVVPAMASPEAAKSVPLAVQPVVTDAWHTVVSDSPRVASPPRPRPLRQTPAPNPNPTPARNPTPTRTPTPIPTSPPIPPVTQPVVAPVGAEVSTVNVGEQLKTAAEGLLRGNPAAAQSALEAIEGKACSVEEAEIRDGLWMLVRMKERVLESFKADAGKEADVALKGGKEHVQILSVEGETVKARRQFTGDSQVAAWVDRSFTYDELAPTERVRRMGEVKETDRNTVRAMFALEARKPEQVRQLLAQADSPLGKLMASRCGLMAKPSAPATPATNDLEAGAERAFQSLLEAANMPTNENDEGARIVAIQKRKFGEAQVGRIKSELGLFDSKFGSSDCALRNRRVLETLSYIRVNGPLYVEDAVLADAWTRLQRANPVGNVKPAVSWNEDGLSLDFSKQNNLLVISPLAGLPIARLDLTGTQVRELAPLRGMPLRVFHGGQGEGSPDQDLGRLAAFSLVDFSYVGSEIKSLKWLFGMPLTNINIRCSWFNHVDLRHLKGMRLCRLGISAWDNRVADISALRGMPISVLELSSGVRFPLSDLDPLVGMKLTSLSVRNSKIYDLNPLKGMPLTRLDLSGTLVRDLRPLKGLPLKWLSLARTSVNDLSALAGIPLEYLDISGTPVTDFSALKDIPTLKNVNR